MTTQFNPLPSPGDFVWCHFPQIPGEPGPKPRPALVVAVFDNDHAIQVAYGTSKKTDSIYPGEFLMAPSDPGFRDSGLAAATKFDLGHCHNLPFDSYWFAPNQSVYASIPLPKMGTLHASFMKTVAEALKRIL